jgi:hypothetical protein
MFEFCFCDFKFFQIQGMGFFKNWEMTALVNVMLHPMGWGGHHITHAQNGREFLKQTLHVVRDRVRDFLCLWNGNRWLKNGRDTGQT